MEKQREFRRFHAFALARKRILYGDGIFWGICAQRSAVIFVGGFCDYAPLRWLCTTIDARISSARLNGTRPVHESCTLQHTGET